MSLCLPNKCTYTYASKLPHLQTTLLHYQTLLSLKMFPVPKLPFQKIFAPLSVLLEEIYPFIELSCQQLSISFVSILFTFLHNVNSCLSLFPSPTFSIPYSRSVTAGVPVDISQLPSSDTFSPSAIHESGSRLSCVVSIQHMCYWAEQAMSPLKGQSNEIFYLQLLS